MLIDITYSCKMGCTHCMSDCKPDGQHMSIQTFKDTLRFLKENNIFPWNFSGGEMFENPDILEMLQILEKEWNKRFPILFATNGRELVRNKEIYNAVSDLVKKYGKRLIMIQVTDDERFYPDKLSVKEKYWLEKIVMTIEPVPGDKKDRNKCLYPQGRALQNFSEENWHTIAPKCANVKLFVKQGCLSVKGLNSMLIAHGKMCTPAIAPDGSIKIGESALCPAVASIYDDDKTIIDKINNFKCHQCEISWNRLKENNINAYNMIW